MAQPINSWSEFKQVIKQLKEPTVKEKFETIIIDTTDIAFGYCEKYICDNAKRADGSFGVDSINEIGYGKGYKMLDNEFDSCLRSIVQMDYGLVLISHAVDKTFTDESGKEFNQIVPTLDKRARNIVSRMADIIGYSRTVTNDKGNNVTKLFMRGTPRYVAGSRFKYTPDYIDFDYNSLVNAICDAIDKQAAEEGNEFFTDERQNLYADTMAALDFDELMDQFNQLVKSMPGFMAANSDNEIENNSEEAKKFKEYYAPRISQITDKYLGKGNKVGNCSREQVEALSLIVDDLEDLLKGDN